MLTFTNFLNTYLGKGGVGNTAENVGQCVGLVEKYINEVLAGQQIWGNAKDLLTNADRNFYDIIDNTPDNMPVIGDIAVWNGNLGNGNGHTSIVIAANLYHLSSFDANWTPQSPCVFVNHDYSNIVGWLHKKGGVTLGNS